MKNNDFLFSGLSGEFAKKASSTAVQPNVKPGPAPTAPVPAEAAQNLIQSSDSVLVFLGVLGTFVLLGGIAYFVAGPGDFKRLKDQIAGKQMEPDQQFSGRPVYGVGFERRTP